MKMFPKSLLYRIILPGLGLLVLLLVAAACGGGDAEVDGNGQDQPGNLFANGNFEAAVDPTCTTDTLDCWYALKAPDFIVSQDEALSGSSSILLQMREDKDSVATKIHYLLQETDPEEIPEVISGSYFVDGWVKGTEKQYLQFVVIAFDGGENLQPCPEGNPCPNYQIRYLLSGIDEEPFFIANAKFVFIDTEDPKEGEWVSFERNLKQDFIDLWGGVPEGFTKLRVLFEVRYDKKDPTEGPIEADVYYDDLYMGPAS